ncbi:MAG: BREX-1 system adenine-specific DNA-methyltransferase PglX [Bacteroidales bacterium]|nr:BREX-1 system adenine-specific DNA-methyltransferase PglX [Bacteroidales bacterium]
MDYKPIIESRYNRQNWQNLLHDIFQNRIQFWASPFRVDINNDTAKCAYYLGKIQLADGKALAIYEVSLSDSVIIERNKVSIRNLLVSHWKSNGFAGAFMFCFKQNESVLRFSYVSEILAFNADGKLGTEATDTKRFTYYLGEGHRSRTAIERFTKLKNSEQTLNDITKAFSVEALSDAFFAGYKDIYEDIVEYMTGKRMSKVDGKWKEIDVHKPNAEIADQFAVFDNPLKSMRDYVKKLMGRLVFLQFLQKKGWLGVKQNAAWGTGDSEFMLNLFNNSKYQDDFIEKVLEPLFNDINTKRENDFVTDANVGVGIKIPFLNGGLFERDKEDETVIKLPSRYFEKLFEFFGQYNFTIDENDPNDTEVGVDPEMLGRIFENLLEDNKDKGAFYTPKEIVRYMCSESLVAYLQTDVEDESEKEAVRKFVSSHDVALLTDAMKSAVRKKLVDVKICDPAIGSGAFPIGLLNELFACMVAIDGEQANRAEIKKHIIQNNIYGIDIEKGAVDIARLRFWLSLIVDENTPHALPNMDFKIMQGNSLLEQYEGVELSGMSLDEQKKSNTKKGEIYQTSFAFDEKLALDNIQKAIRQFYLTENHDDKVLLRQTIDDNVKNYILNLKGCTPEIQHKLENLRIPNDQFFLWHIYFKEVFDKGGFDIVIGNPPYIRPHNLSAHYKELLWDNYSTFEKKADLYVCFIEKGINLTNEKGFLNFIVSDGWLRLDSFESIRKYILQRTSVQQIVDFSEDVFPSATVKTSIFLFSSKVINNNHINVAEIANTAVLANVTFKQVPQIAYSKSYKSVFDLSFDVDSFNLKRKIEKNSIKLGNRFKLSFGLKTGDDQKFISFSKEHPLSRKLLRGADINRYTYSFKGEYVIYDPDAMCNHKKTARPGNKERFEQPKVLIRDTGGGLMGTYDDEFFYVKDVIIISDQRKNESVLKALIALLNSRVMKYYYESTFPTLHVQRDELSVLPLNNTLIDKPSHRIIQLIDRILSAKKANPQADTKALEDEIDLLVYHLYGLTYDEVLIIDPETPITREQYEM